MTPRAQAVLIRFALGLVLTEIPILTAALARPDFDWRLLAVGLLGGLAAALDKFLSPQLSTPGAEVAAIGKPGPHG